MPLEHRFYRSILTIESENGKQCFYVPMLICVVDSLGIAFLNSSWLEEHHLK